MYREYTLRQGLPEPADDGFPGEHAHHHFGTREPRPSLAGAAVVADGVRPDLHGPVPAGIAGADHRARRSDVHGTADRDRMPGRPRARPADRGPTVRSVRPP